MKVYHDVLVNHLNQAFEKLGIQSVLGLVTPGIVTWYPGVQTI